MVISRGSTLEATTHSLGDEIRCNDPAQAQVSDESPRAVDIPLLSCSTLHMSNSLDRLHAGIKEIDDLEDLVQLKTKGSKGPTAGITAARRSAVLLLNSHLEAFLEDLLEEALHSINTGFDVAKIRRDFTTPRTSNIDKLFQLIGIEKISQMPSWQRASNKVIRKAIDELQDARNAVAHGERDAKATKSDITRFQKYVIGFAKELDKIVAERVSQMTGKPRPW